MGMPEAGVMGMRIRTRIAATVGIVADTDIITVAATTAGIADITA